MARKDIKKALGASLRAEEQAVKSRFEKAETVLAKNNSSARKGAGPDDGVGRVIRDSFTMPVFDYELISQIRNRCLKAGIGTNKSEVLRAGLAALRAMSEKQLAQVFEGLTKVKTGRPATK